MLKFKKRVREIAIKHSSLSGTINFKLQKKNLQFESSLERDFIYLLEFDKNVSQYIEQPTKISYIDASNKQKKYIPDFAVSYHDNTPNEIIEIKYEKTLSSKFDLLAKKFQAAEEYCKANNYNFRLITEKHIREKNNTQLSNYKFLSRHRDYFYDIETKKNVFHTSDSDLDQLHDKIIYLKKCTVRELVNSCSQDQDKRAELIFLTWYLVANNFIAIDFSKKINLDSVIWHNYPSNLE
ncbi:TnsA endonuclease N-terminal domain-containing protein [Aquimarina sp. Aq78]|uniref:TnsA endonuclease N-terminal domain-containing protein n=1 Tax=Aquimarina sp. Aq78 TaxID=1191889 RepID=UPI000D0F24F1|nr:TnsA endonuclease N-terminal domain-containing protein [Aquimarina sp. Aq78]